MKILVTGGAGYIGSHMVRLLVGSRHEPVIFDNLSTGHRRFIPKEAAFVKGDLQDFSDIRSAFKKFRINAVMHFAACALVGESVANPVKYFENNVNGSLNLLKAMLDEKVRFLIFSSTCAVYGQPKKIPIGENEPKTPLNPYGQSKWTVECLLKGFSKVTPLRYAALRYFNACGAHRAGSIGEVHNPETHLIPNVLKTACGKKEQLEIFGDDYDTPDGTCIRDYVHVEDIARAHLLAFQFLKSSGKSEVFNLGIEKGYSVKEIIQTAEKVTGRKIKSKVSKRRPGDPPRLIADSAKIRKILGWEPQIGLREIIRSAWEWERSVVNPR